MESNNLIVLKEDPLELFTNWFNEANQKELNDPNAMVLSTISEKNQISSRVVLLKFFDKNGFVFYSNIESKKGQSILFNPRVSLNFYWKSLKKQIRIEGIAERVSDQQAEKYFSTRTKESKIGAWVSTQSKELQNREELENSFIKLSKKFENEKIPKPPYWSGYRVKPELIEFWLEKPFRLHDRLEYTKKDEGWIKKRLYP